MKYIGFLAVAAVLTGCAAAPGGALGPPESWQPSKSLSNCGSTDGRFEEIGAPAAENARAGLSHSAWPVMASLSTMVRTGANGMPHGAISAVSVEIVDGRPHFKAYSADGAEVPLAVREWWCDEKALVSRVVLGNVSSDGVPKVRDESVLRVWRAMDGALIAEQTLESVTPGLFGSSSHHRPLTRTYFRFPSVLREPPVSAVPAASSS